MHWLILEVLIFITSNMAIIGFGFRSILKNKEDVKGSMIEIEPIKTMVELLKPISELVKSIRS